MGSKAACRFQLDHPAVGSGPVPELGPGDALRGRVQVTAGEELKLNSLAIQLVWSASGKGNTDTVTVGEVKPPEITTLAAGKSVEVAFSFRVPESGPLSYEGEYVKVCWALRVYLDIPWAIDDQDDYPLLVRPRHC